MFIKTINVVAAAIYNDRDQILCFQRGPGRSLAGLWEFPGGKIEPGESQEEALIREIKEELKAELIISQYIGEAAYDYDFGRVEMKLYSATITDNQYQLTEHLQAKWVDRSQLMSLDWAPVDIPLAQELMTKKNL
ncbi:(deoxy)nucleoside triphosphate pyrophosphohydrolase [Ignavigranum ruoffiae]|uniref:(deoxy)nucleoside triphosphate pyrophosphohydrolase n=1 Tax=Ignavigranum ruoffiae TaxID=89093 RepID=UPI00205D101C|nr:(deoxy)nucleoside triphosphate pyrophosphohydrolase [Ignavigranum ruoffiae]UPQ86694.1 (deoxy)nucleoside triphosphate pyrophosphohydrolase [Ignavigranum ruoffiae]